MSQMESSRHFRLEQLVEGVYAAIAIEGGAAFSNAGIIDLGDQTLIFDTCETATAAYDLRAAAEQLTGRPATCAINSHAHPDHWGGNQVFDTPILATRTTREQMRAFAHYLEELKRNPRAV